MENVIPPWPSWLSWPFFDPSHRELASRCDAWAVKALAGQTDPHKEDAWEQCRGLVSNLAEGGWLTYVIPRSHGGQHESIDVRSVCLIRETLARHEALADFSFAMQGLGSAPISLFGTPTQKTTYLPPTATGEKIAAFALSEPNAGSDVSAISMRAEKTSDGYRLNGDKTWISNGGIADYYVVFARTEPEAERPGTKGLSAFVIDADNAGLTIEERIEVTAPHPLARIGFRNAPVSESALVGKRGEGFKVAMSTLDVFRPSVGAAALGMAKRAFREAASQAASREMFGQHLADLQLTQAKLSTMATEIDASALLVYRAAWSRDVEGGRRTIEASMAKMYATEAAQRTIDQAVQIFGARGVVKNHIVERLYREVRALRIYEGATEVHQQIIAKQILKDLQSPEGKP